MTKIVAVCNQKGGAGKSTTAVGLAAVIAQSGRCLLVDVDEQGTATEWCELAQELGTLPFDFTATLDPEILSELREDASDWDYIVVDTPGKLADTPVLEAVLRQADFALLPVPPAAASQTPTLRTVDIVRRIQAQRPELRYRAVINIVDPRRIRVAESMRVFLAEEKIPVFRQMIRRYAAHEDAPATGAVVTQYGGTPEAMKAAEDYRVMAMELALDLSSGRP